MVNARENHAKIALELFIQIQGLQQRLEAEKDAIRDLANGNKLEIVVAGLGKVNVTAPRAGSETTVLVFDEERLAENPTLRVKLLEKGIAKEEVKKTSPAKASVTVKPNV
jgi:hypothetical protein